MDRSTQTDRQTDMADRLSSGADQEFMGSETSPFNCYILSNDACYTTNLVYPLLSDKSSIPFYSSSNGYNKGENAVDEYLDYQTPFGKRYSRWP